MKILLGLFVGAALGMAGGAERKNWVGGGEEGVGAFRERVPVASPWGGVDTHGDLRKPIAAPTANPFISKSNQFTYAWLGTSAVFVDLDGDGLKDLVSPDGAGMVWAWKNWGAPGRPLFKKGEVVPVLFDDLRSEFAPIAPPGQGATAPQNQPALSRAEIAARERIDAKRQREFERLKARNDRLPPTRRKSDRELRQIVEEENPYPPSATESAGEEDAEPRPTSRWVPGQPLPPGGLSCTLNTFRRLRLVVHVADVQGDGLPDLVAGDALGAIYLAANRGTATAAVFGYCPRSTHTVPLKVLRPTLPSGQPGTPRAVEFMNYSTPHVADWNRDGLPDLLVGEGTYSVNAIRLFPSAFRATLMNPPREEILYSGEERTFLSPFVNDADGDGWPDLFVCDAEGRLTFHRQTPSGLAEPVDVELEGGNAALAYCAPQPCDWNEDGILDILWGDPFGRILVALGKPGSQPSFSKPFAVQSSEPAERILIPANRKISTAAVPVLHQAYFRRTSDGGTGNADQFVDRTGTARFARTGWPLYNSSLHGTMPGWSGADAPPLERHLRGDNWDKVNTAQASWAVAAVPGDIWEIIEESGAPGEGDTLRLRWQTPDPQGLFPRPGDYLPPWTQGAALHIHPGRPGPHAEFYTPKPIHLKAHLRLEGQFSRVMVIFSTTWGPLKPDGKPPAEGGTFYKVLDSPPHGQWFEFNHTEAPHPQFHRGLDGALTLLFFGRGEIRVRDLRVFDGNE